MTKEREIINNLKELIDSWENELDEKENNQLQSIPYITKEIIFVPYKDTQTVPSFPYNQPYGIDDDPCANCPNNPVNNPFSSGFCNCALPYMVGSRRVIC